jgi:F-type H+-transporting ATPase subunit gamma
LIAEEVLRENADAVRVLFNKFHSAISFKPTMATVLSPTGVERQLATEQGSKLDTYELEVAAERVDVLQDLAEFQLAAVSGGSGGSGRGVMVEGAVGWHVSEASKRRWKVGGTGQMMGEAGHWSGQQAGHIQAGTGGVGRLKGLISRCSSSSPA